MKPLRYTILIVSTVAAYFLALQIDGNFHETIPHELYRSAQMRPGDLTRYVQKYGIRSVLNLRGENADTNWYQQEMAESNAAHIEHINFRMSAKRGLPVERVEELIALMRNAPKPLLIHCQGGADRTGLAAALYVVAIKKASRFEAELQLSMLYGHLPFRFTAAYPMTQTFEELEPWLAQTH